MQADLLQLCWASGHSTRIVENAPWRFPCLLFSAVTKRAPVPRRLILSGLSFLPSHPFRPTNATIPHPSLLSHRPPNLNTLITYSSCLDNLEICVGTPWIPSPLQERTSVAAPQFAPPNPLYSSRWLACDSAPKCLPPFSHNLPGPQAIQLTYPYQ